MKHGPERRLGGKEENRDRKRGRSGLILSRYLQGQWTPGPDLSRHTDRSSTMRSRGDTLEACNLAGNEEFQ